MGVLNSFYVAFFSDPMYFIGCLFAVWGMVGFLLFVRGFAGGVRHLFTVGESDTHMEHARERIIWGLFLSMTAFGSWELVRVIAGEVSVGYLWISFFMLTPLWVPWLLRGGKPAKSAH